MILLKRQKKGAILIMTAYGNSIMIEDDCHMATFVSAKELQAINKQVEELGWNKKED